MRDSRTSGSVGAPGGRLPGATDFAPRTRVRHLRLPSAVESACTPGAVLVHASDRAMRVGPGGRTVAHWTFTRPAGGVGIKSGVTVAARTGVTITNTSTLTITTSALHRTLSLPSGFESRAPSVGTVASEKYRPHRPCAMGAKYMRSERCVSAT